MKYFQLTTPQQNIWNLQKYYNGTAIANLCGAIFFPERRDSELLCQAVRQFIHNQSGIRLRFSEGEEPGQYISDEAGGDIPVKVFRTREEFDIYAEGCARNPIGLSDRQMYRFVVFHLEQEDRSGILPVLSHLVSDAWTFGVMANQLDAAYRKLAGEKEVSLLEGDYEDFIRLEETYLTSVRYEKDKRYWEEKYPVRPEECPVKLRAASVESVEAGRITRILTSSLEQSIQTYCKNHPVTEAVLFETALVIYLSRINSDIQTVTVGVPVLNRGNAKEKEIAGMFVSTMPLTVVVTGSTEIVELTRQITKGHMDLFRHQKYPYAEILRHLREKWDFSGNLYDVMISYQNARTKTEADTKWYSNGFSEVPLAIHIDNRDEKVCHTVNVDFQTAVFRDEAEVKLLIDRLEYILGQIVEESVSCVGEVEIVPPEECDRIVNKFNDTYVDYPRDKCVHELFMEQAARTPEKVALVFEGKEFTYRQLDEMSNSLAHFLRGKGVKPNDVVPIIARRSWHVVVAMLGVLKAGGAYMPVDPDYPADRIRYMLSEIEPKIVLVYGYVGNNAYEEVDLAVADYGKHSGLIENRSSSGDICYVLYTSGSAGMPKAVCVSHANMRNFNNNNNKNHYQYALLETCGTVLADTKFIFDISAFEIFLPLLNGLCLVLAKDTMDAPYLAGLIEEHHVDALHTTPTKLLTLLNDHAFQRAIAQVKILMAGAEIFTENLYQTVSKYTDAVLYNGYGPTETTIGCSFKRVGGKHQKCVHELFMEQAARTPDKTALVFEDEKFTYSELNKMSNSLAYFLRKKEIEQGSIVPIIAKRSWHVVVAMLGVLKAGGAYMLIDYQYPAERISYLVQECKADIILVYGCEYADAIDLKKMDFSKNTGPIESINRTGDILCVIHTSGSTGVPKVTALSHENIAHYIDYAEELFRGTSQTIATTTITFDAFIQETLVSLCRQVPVILLSEMQTMNQNEFENVLKKYRNSFLFQTPTKLLSYIRNSKAKKFLAQIAIFVIGGEVFPQELYDAIRTYNPGGRIYNIYGPTETTVCAVVNKLGNGADITIGTPIANTQIYILNSDLSPVPIGVPGELCIAGEGVGKGYLNRPELTAEKFVPNPFATEENRHGKIMYRTGDLARFRSDGEIEYLGRIDTQVKIRGLRIELGEIESVMGSMEGIGLVAAADKRDENGRQYLVGYYTAEEAVDERKLRSVLAARLPRYMVPNYFMRLEAMPMTASGKMDRKNLPVPDFTQQGAEYAAPETDTERRLAAIWQELLKVERVGRTDDFFELGGDSLLAISMLNEIERNFHVGISVREIMEQSELSRLAACVENARPVECIAARHADRYILLPQQKAIYAACMKEPDSLLYNMPARVPLPGGVDRDRLKESIARVTDCHRILKSHVGMEGTELCGVYEGDAQIVFEEYEKGKEDAFVRPFDLGKAPLVRIGFTENALLVDMHHIIADGDSMNVILRDIASVYGGGELREPQAEFSDYAAYFYGLDTEEYKAYFREALKGGAEPTVLPQTAIPGQGGNSRVYRVPRELMEKAREYGRQNGLTDTMVFMGVYGILLAGYTGKKEVLSSVVLQNRTHADTRDMVGMFVNTLPVCLAVEGGTAEYMGQVKKRLLGLLRCQELPFEDIAEAAGLDKAVVNTAFVYQGDGEKTLVLEGQELIPQPLHTHAAKFDLSLELTPTGDGGRLRLEYRLEKYGEQLMDDLADAYLRILGLLDRERIADISVLSDAERRRIVEQFNDTYMDYPRDKCVHELFMEQVARTPERVALVFEGREFTYRQLDEMSNSLAHFLRGKGVRPNDVVPIIARRSWHVVVAMLGVLKAGGGYMLADLSYPDSRINYMIGELDAKVVLTLGYKVESGVAVDEIDLELFEYDKKTTVLSNINHVDDVLAIIFTSGTTGQPKGTALCHKGAVNFTYANDALYANCNYIVGLATVTFDAFFLDTICPIIRGIPCILTDESEQYNSDKFGMLISQYKYVNMFCTPTKLLNLLMACKDIRIFENISGFCIGGEVFSTDLYKLIKKANRGINVYNVYGPTETTMWISAKRVNGLSDITIGKPIANTQIYILNSDLSPVPIGVPGELCIAGEGVGKGYLNRPELTAEKFVPNPFATEENRHGKVMYRTGDLARFRSDGEIEYLGRIDTQVKIRGLRIELGEIESVMGSMEGIGLVAAADKRDESGRQYLVGYYTSEEAVDERKLRSLLAARLPRYMVPNYFMRLEVMPMTASGKTDRKNLPVPDFTQRAGEYVAPAAGRERELCRLMEELLHVEQVGVTDDFFELGGDSLTAIEFLAKARDRGIDFFLQNVFDYPTVEQLCRHMEEGEEAKVSYAPSDFDRYRELLERNVTEEDFVPRKKSLGNVLLTGATGFLGAHVLDRLLREETGKVYCLVRAGEVVCGQAQDVMPGVGVKEGLAKEAICSRTQEGETCCRSAQDGRIAHCRERLRETLRYYFGDRYEAEFAAGQAGNQMASGGAVCSRIIPVAGDIESEVLAENMPEDVHTVIHTAASVKHYGSYGYFHRVNVEGTEHVVNYARSVGARLIHISTLSVSGNSLGDDFTVYRSEEEKHFDETSFYIGQPLDNVYVHSKFEAERAVFDAMLNGLDAKIIRVGNLTSRASDYKFQPNYRQNAFLTRVKAILEFGLFPDYLMPLYCEFSPIDLTAEGVVKIAQYADRQTVFHLNSNRPIYFDRFLEVVRELGISMKVVDGDTFNRALRGTVRDRVTEYIFEAFQNDMDGQGRLLYDSNIRIDNDFTVRFLEKLGFAWSEIDMEYIRGYVEYLREIGYLTV